ncbi:MAG: HupE/UreJ family protein [Gammaproteobacteria bacterium]
MNRTTSVFRLLAFASVLLPSTSFAHTGIGAVAGFGAGFAHPFSGLDHLLAMLAVGLWAAQMGGQALWRLPAAFVTLMLCGGVLALLGLQVPHVEAGIVASVWVLGVLIATACRLSAAVGAALVGVFALFHGHAHGAEMPLVGSTLGYVVGFALATACLHAAGLLGGLGLRRLNASGLLRYAGGVIACAGVYLAAV